MAPRGKDLSKDLIIKYFKGSKTVRGIAEIVKKEMLQKSLGSIKLWVRLRISLDLVALVRLQQSNAVELNVK